MRSYDVAIHGLLAGRLQVSDSGHSSFQLASSYRDAAERPVLGQQFEDDPKKQFTARRSELPPFFANLVPEGKLRKIVEKALDLEDADDARLLAALGEDLPGAITIRSSRAAGVTEPATDDALARGGDQNDGLRFSLAGVQLKFSLSDLGDRLTIPSGDRQGDVLVKLPDRAYPGLVDNEFMMLEWARASGLEVPDVAIRKADELPEQLRGYLSEPSFLQIRRYDRTPDGGRIHQEDFAQVLGLRPSLKYYQATYADLGNIVRKLCGGSGFDDYVRRLVFVVACGNGDAHLKNWSLTYPDRVRATLSPVYDQVSTVAWEHLARELTLKLGAVKSFADIDTNTWRHFATKSDDDPLRVLEVVEAFTERLGRMFLQVREQCDLDRSHERALRDHWRAVPHLRRHTLE